LLPCGWQCAIRCSGSGLTANRINQPNASGLYPAFDGSSCSPRPALCYRPLRTLSLASCDREPDLARAPDAAPTGKTAEAVKERVWFYAFCGGSQSKSGGNMCLILNRVQAVHRRVQRKWCRGWARFGKIPGIYRGDRVQPVVEIAEGIAVGTLPAYEPRALRQKEGRSRHLPSVSNLRAISAAFDATKDRRMPIAAAPAAPRSAAHLVLGIVSPDAPELQVVCGVECRAYELAPEPISVIRVSILRPVEGATGHDGCRSRDASRG